MALQLGIGGCEEANLSFQNPMIFMRFRLKHHNEVLIENNFQKLELNLPPPQRWHL